MLVVRCGQMENCTKIDMVGTLWPVILNRSEKSDTCNDYKDDCGEIDIFGGTGENDDLSVSVVLWSVDARMGRIWSNSVRSLLYLLVLSRSWGVRVIAIFLPACVLQRQFGSSRTEPAWIGSSFSRPKSHCYFSNFWDSWQTIGEFSDIPFIFSNPYIYEDRLHMWLQDEGE